MEVRHLTSVPFLYFRFTSMDTHIPVAKLCVLGSQVRFVRLCDVRVAGFIPCGRFFMVFHREMLELVTTILTVADVAPMGIPVGHTQSNSPELTIRFTVP